MPEEPEKFLSVEECAQILRKSVRWMYDQLRSGKGPKYIKFGGVHKIRYRIRYSSLMQWIQQKEH